MQQIALIFICLIIGILLRWSGRLPDTTTKVLGGWVINVALPAAAIHSMYGVTLRPDYWLAALTPWIGAVLAIAVMVPLSLAFGWSRQRTGAILLVGGWGNTSFVGLPMIAAFAGSQWLGLGIVIDLFGSYLALSTLGLGIATVASAGKFDWRAVARRIATFPPFIAILVAFATAHVPRPEWVSEIVRALADTLTPIALAAVGFALRIDRLSGRPRRVCRRARVPAVPLAARDRAAVPGPREGGRPRGQGGDARDGDAADARRKHHRNGPQPRAGSRRTPDRHRCAAFDVDGVGLVVGDPLCVATSSAMR